MGLIGVPPSLACVYWEKGRRSCHPLGEPLKGNYTYNSANSLEKSQLCRERRSTFNAASRRASGSVGWA